MEWMPIDTAPRDGTRFLAYWPHGLPDDNGYIYDPIIAECYYYFEAGFTHTDENGDEYTVSQLIANGLIDEDIMVWICGAHGTDEFDYNAPTHWMPLPQPPTN